MAVTAEARWEEMRALYEGGAATFERLATVAALTAKAVAQKAARDEWVSPADSEEAEFARIHGLQAIAMAEIDAAMAARGDAGFDKVRIELGASALKVVEKLLDTKRAALLVRQQAERARQAEHEDADNAGQKQEERDAEIAEVLESIEDQIDRLARDYAKELAGGQDGPGQGGAGGE